MKKLLSLVGAGMLSISAIAPLVGNTTHKPTTKEIISVKDEIIQTDSLEKEQNKDLTFFENIDFSIHKKFNGTYSNEFYVSEKKLLFNYLDYADSLNDFVNKYQNFKIIGTASSKVWDKTIEITDPIFNTSDIKPAIYNEFKLISYGGWGFFCYQDILLDFYLFFDSNGDVSWGYEYFEKSFAISNPVTLDADFNSIQFY